MMAWEMQAATTWMMLEYSVSVLKILLFVSLNFNLIILFSIQGPCVNETVRLVDKVSDRQGAVEICINNLWHSVLVSEGRNNLQEASVVCSQLGFSPVGKNIMSSFIRL